MYGIATGRDLISTYILKLFLCKLPASEGTKNLIKTSMILVKQYTKRWHQYPKQSARDNMNNQVLNNCSTTFYTNRNRAHTVVLLQKNTCSQVLNNRSTTFDKHGVEPDGKQNNCHHQKKNRGRIEYQRGCSAVQCCYMFIANSACITRKGRSRKVKQTKATQRNDPVQNKSKPIQSNIIT